MKKQFFRVKQLADQTFSRAGKTEALSDDLVQAEKRIEFLNKTCQNISKKLASTLLGLGQDSSARDKRLSKCQEFILADVLSECCTDDLDEILKHFLLECSEILEKVARYTVDADARIETSVLYPLQQIIDIDVPNIMKQKRNLTRLILDMDSLKNRYQTAIKHTTTSNSAGSVTKAETIKDELEDLEMKVEQCRDALACDMFQLISKEAILANVLLDFIRLQQAAHRTALAVLDVMVPELESKIEHSSMKPVFGISLEEHLRLTQRRIAYPLELCVCVLLELGMEEEGLFRMAGGTNKIRRLKFGLDINFITMDTAMEYRDVHIFSNALKSYFRELPEPLLTFALYDEWLACIRCSIDENTRLSALWSVLHKLPQPNFDNLRYFIKFLSVLTKKQDFNKMSAQNLAIVIAPNLIWNPNVNCSIGENMNLANLYSSIVESLVKYADWFFPGDEIFYVTIEEVPTRTKRHARSSSADLRLNAEFTNTSDSNSSIKRCQSTTSLEDQIQNCPLPDSPKPITRTRKNKPAPIPPAASANPDNNTNLSSSVSAPSSNVVTPTKEKTTSMKLSVQSSSKKIVSAEFSPHENEDSVSEEFNTLVFQSDITNVNHEDGKESSFKSSKTKLFTDENVQSASSVDVTRLLSSESLNKITDSKKLGKPVPAPRISLENQTRGSNTDEVIPRKPVIPEKPTTLPRPISCSFKSMKIADLSDKSDNEKSKGPSLEKAHLYSVDKQQVSFIDIASSSDEPTTPDSHQDNGTLTRSRINASHVHDKNHGGDRSVNSLKPEGDRGQNSSHIRALSDGHNIDTSTANLPPLRSFHKLQRPMPPPPPPPVATKPHSRPGSVSDSTNL